MKNPVKIRIDSTTREELHDMKKVGDTYDDVIRRLIKTEVLAKIELGVPLIQDFLDNEEKRTS